ncbi:hypothetical protein F2P81_008203 [Scophthalmus maximus]|uniref:Uncharacterized protein n=1 Tax=Scophthalmus maximus TaxID=52904 RepID=A0A6A4T6M1_SCOMX|nr:hypothetical protein F2P81_008203 [Scophthalmus maximus]
MTAIRGFGLRTVAVLWKIELDGFMPLSTFCFSSVFLSLAAAPEWLSKSTVSFKTGVCFFQRKDLAQRGPESQGPSTKQTRFPAKSACSTVRGFRY